MLFSIERAINEINQQIRSTKFGSEPPNLYDPLYYIMNLGGKRIRPLLALLSYQLYKDHPYEILKPAIGLEVFHNFTLMHDDIMDKAPLRRGQPTVHEKWNSNIAILSGDVMLVKAYELFLEIPDDLIKQVLQSFNKCAAGVCEGQQLDVDYETATDVSMQQYINMITLKTAVLLGFCCELGGILGRASERDVLLLRKLGVNIGIAFQLKDDLLDVFGEQVKVGKQVGGDILSRKKTFLLLESIQKAKGEDLELLKSVFFHNNYSGDDVVEKVTRIFRKLQIEDMAKQTIHFYYEQGLQCISQLKAPLIRKGKLKNFLDELMVREK